MVKVYALDLRKKVMAYVKSGKRVEAAKFFNLERRITYG
jgi:hypothetical protein